MLRLRRWYEDPEFYKTLSKTILTILLTVIDYCISLEILIRYLRFRGVPI
jgi:hypothetical protein